MNGLITGMTADELNKALGEPFPETAIQTRPGGRGTQLRYVEGHTVIHRLNDATGNRWNFSVDKIERTQLDEQNALLMAYVTLEIPGLGTRSHIGVQSVNARGGEDLVKGAVTDALKKAATLFGVGLELYGPDYEAGEMPAATPARTRSTSANTAPGVPVAVPTTVDDWSAFWKAVEGLGYPRDKKELERRMGASLPQDAAFAWEVFQGWRKDNPAQAVLT